MTQLSPLPGQVLEVVRAIDQDPDYTEGQARELTRDVEGATVLTSRVDDGTDEALTTPDFYRPRHKVVIDLDLPAQLIPSSTPGHFHLIIDKEMSWGEYTGLLLELARVGIVERGFVSASVSRGHTAVRLPWVPKGPPQ